MLPQRDGLEVLTTLRKRAADAGPHSHGEGHHRRSGARIGQRRGSIDGIKALVDGTPILRHALLRAAFWRPSPTYSRHWVWADLMRRAFDIDVLARPRCGGRLRLIATVE